VRCLVLRRRRSRPRAAQKKGKEKKKCQAAGPDQVRVVKCQGGKTERNST